jgi:hypothetical protein
MNVSRAGAVFVPAVLTPDRDFARLAERLAETCVAVYEALLELEE